MTKHHAAAVTQHGAAITEAFAQSSAVIAALTTDDELIASLATTTATCVDALKAGRKIRFVGNGGSAADAQHLARELVARFNFDRPALAAAVAPAQASGGITVALRGQGGQLGESCDLVLRTPSSRTPHIQEGHIVISHTLCASIEREMCPRDLG